MKKLCEGTINDALDPSEIKILNEIIQITKEVCLEEIGKDPKFLLIGMCALYFYFGREAFSPAIVSVEIDINFDILIDWAPYRHRIPNQIKNKLELQGYDVKSDIGLISILKEGLLIHLTIIFEHKEEIIGAFIPELQIHAGDKYFLIYYKLSRGDPVKDLSRLRYLFQHCHNRLDFSKIYAFAYKSEVDIIKNRVDTLLGKAISNKK